MTTKSEIDKAAEDYAAAKIQPSESDLHNAVRVFSEVAFIAGARKLLELAEAKHQKVICRSDNPNIYWMVIDTRTLRELVEGVPACGCTLISICENCRKKMSKPQTTGDESV